MEDIRKYKLADYIDSFGDGIHGTPNYDENGEYYFINGNNLKNGKIEITSNTLKISSDEYKRIKRNLSDNTLLVSINGTLGNIAFYNNEKIALGKSACFLNLNKCACRPFIRYVLESKEFKTYMNRVAGQSTIKNVSPTQVSEYEFFAPSYSDQARIAKVLSTIDREITINREINRNLEELAKQIYDYWFVQFDFPNEEGKPYKSSGGKMVWNDVLKREIPDGWEVKLLKDIIEIKRGITITEKQTTSGTIKVVAAGLTYSYLHGESNRTPNCITVSGSGANAGFVNFWREPIFASDCSTIQFDNDIDTILCYYTLKKQEKRFYQISHKSAQPHILPSDIGEIPMVIPSNSIKERITQFFIKTNKQIAENTKELEHLTSLRDNLVPLLMNGQVTLNSCLSEQHFYLFVKFNLWEVEGVCNMNAKTQIIEKLQEQLIKTLDAEKANRICRILDEILAEFSICKISKRETKTDLLLDDFIQAKKLEGCSAKTLAYYKSTLEKLFISSKKIATEISSEDIRTYLSNFQTSRQVSKMTIDNNRRIFSTFFSWLENEDLIIKSPMRKIHKVKQDITVQKVFTDENMVILRDNCMDARSKALVDLLESTGMRVGELVKLNRTDIDFEQRQTIVIGKGSKEREVYFNASAKLHLKEYLNSRIDDSPALFVQKKAPYNRLSISGIESSLRKLGQCANINKVHPHRFRRTMATEAINRGMPIEQVQRLLGHAKIDTTMRYAQVDQQNVKMSHRKYLG